MQSYVIFSNSLCHLEFEIGIEEGTVGYQEGIRSQDFDNFEKNKVQVLKE